MANQTLRSPTITFLDTTDDRKLDVYITSNLPTTVIYNTNMGTYTPDWSITNLQLAASIYLNSKDITNETQITAIWYKKIGTGAKTQISTGVNLTIATNEMTNDSDIITYICESEYQGIKAQSQITFIKVNTGKDGTSVTIKGTAYYDGKLTQNDIGTQIRLYSDEILKTPINTSQLNEGDGYIVQGYLCVYDPKNKTFICTGTIQGPKGDQGESAKNITLNADSQIFKVDKNNDIYPSKISVTAQTFNTVATNWSYSTNGGKNFLSNTPNGVTRLENTVTIVGASMTNDSIVIKASDGTYSDTYTIYKVYDGISGTQGDDGESVSIAFLTNENITFSANSQGQIPVTAITSNVVAYNGVTKVLPTIGEIAGLPEGMSITSEVVDISNEIMLTISIANNSTLGSSLSNNGTINIPILSPITTVLSLNWSKINTGLTGEKGNNAVVFQVYSTNGYVLSKDIPHIRLQTFAYIGDVPIEAGATYQWYKYSESDWELIPKAIDNYLNISHYDISFSGSYMCKMIFNDVEYVGVATIDDKNDTNTVFTSKPYSYMAGDVWVVGEDYAPSGVEIGTVLKSEHTSDAYNDEDWISATIYDKKLQTLQDNIDEYNQYFSFNKEKGMIISAKDENGVPSKFSTGLSNTQLSFNYEGEAIAYINGSKMNIKEAEVESPLTVTGKYSDGVMSQAPIINLGNFSLIVEGNGSLSIVSNSE